MKTFSKGIPESVDLPIVAESGGLFGWFSHKVTGDELNDLTEQVQNHLIKQNGCIVKIIGEFKTIYKTFETLDTDYMQKITDALFAAQEANRKAKISIDGLEKNHSDISKLISQQGQIIKVLSNFKAEIEKIKHIAEVDNIFENVTIIQNEAEQLSKLLGNTSSEINEVKSNLSSARDEQEKIQTKIRTLEESQKTYAEKMKDLSLVDEQLSNDINELRKESYNIAEEINKKIPEKIAKQKNEVFEKIDTTKKQFESTINTSVSALSNEIQKNRKEQDEILTEINEVISSNKEETDNSLQALENYNLTQDTAIESFKKEIEVESSKITELTASLTKLTKFFKWLAIISCSGIFILFILIILLISGVL